MLDASSLSLAARGYQGSPIREDGQLPSLNLKVLNSACGAEEVVSKNSAAQDVGKV